MSAVNWRGSVALVPCRGRVVEVDCSALEDLDVDVISRIVDIDLAQNEDGGTAVVMRLMDAEAAALRALGVSSWTIAVDGAAFALTDTAFRDERGQVLRLELGWTEATA